MRVVFATDLSPAAEQARALVATAPWPLGTEIEVFSVLEPYPFALLAPGAVPGPEEAYLDGERAKLAELARSLERPGITLGANALPRPPYRDAAQEIAEEAARFGADLIVVGSRGHGAVATTLLGSVSAAVVDRAPCPVLVCRSGSLERIVLAEDGSSGAAAAAALVRDWPLFDRADIEVASVVDLASPLSLGLNDRAWRLYLAEVDAAREHGKRVARSRAVELAAAGRSVRSSVREGAAVKEILETARDTRADCIVMGSRGHTGIARVFAGSVARGVLFSARCSVLIVRGFARVEQDATPQRLVAAGR